MSENNEVAFVGGMVARPPHENSPHFCKARVSIKREELIAWLQGRSEEWLNVDIKKSKGGKWYAALDSWKPDANRSAQAAR